MGSFIEKRQENHHSIDGRVFAKLLPNPLSLNQNQLEYKTE
jgi:hypothetical protein